MSGPRLYDAAMPPTPEKTRVGFLGPRGTFAEEALLTQPDLAAAEAVPFRDVPHVINAVEHGEVDVGIVPIENSIEGSIPVTLDTLAFDTDLLVQREVDLPISLNLCARPGTQARRHHDRRVAPEPARPDPGLAGQEPARRGPGRRQLHRRGRAAGGEVEAHGDGVDRHRPGREARRARDPRPRHRGPPGEPHPLRDRRPRHPGADGPRQDVGRVLPAPGPSGLAARDPPGVRGAGDQPHQARVAARRSRAWATTASSSTSKAISTTRSSPTASATSRRSRPR